MLTDSLREEKALHPLLSLVLSIPIFLVGIPLVPLPLFWVYPVSFSLLFLLFGYGKVWLKITLFGLPFLLLSSLLTLIGAPPLRALQNGLRMYLLLLAATLTLPIEPLRLMRSLNQIRFPRPVSIGILISLRFLHVLKEDFRRIRIAMKTRSATGFLRPGVVYRAFLMPLIMRVFTLSDLLSVSLETRAFSVNGASTSYEKIVWKTRDSLFLLLTLILIGGNLYAAFR